MDKAASCRRAARDAVADVEPPRLQDVIVDQLDGASMTPGVLTLECAAAIDPDADLEAVSHRAAGVQLIYEGLGLTRRLAQDEPWTDGIDARTRTDGEEDWVEADAARRADRGDLEILAADILVARGFYLLARTDAAGKAVRTVQSFGRDQTLRAESASQSGSNPGPDPDALDSNLERDVLELAVLTGAAAVGSTPTAALIAIANDVADRVETGFPAPEACLPTLEVALETASRTGSDSGIDSDTDTEQEREVETETNTPSDGVQTDPATSATDP